VTGLLVFEIVRTAPVRDAVKAYTALISAANRQDLTTARSLCTPRYLQTHRLRAASEGGLVGLPRNINKNFQAWREEADVWVCPTNRVGPVFRFVRQAGGWKFDGPVGLLRPGGFIEPFDEELESETP
jgi:hypothetical protein